MILSNTQKGESISKTRKFYTEDEISEVMLQHSVKQLQGDAVPREGTFFQTTAIPQEALLAFENRWGYPAEYWWQGKNKQWALGPSGKTFNA